MGELEGPAITSAIPIDIERAVRTASVAPHVRAMFAHLPQAVRVDATLPVDVATAPAAALQLLKLAFLGERVRLGVIEIGSAARVIVSRGERSCELGPVELNGELRGLARVIVTALFEGGDLARVLEAFAFRSSSLATLQRITHRMLQATDVDSALYVMLSGITAGYGLAFHRAALFVRDDARGTFVGAKAIGPADEAEAHRIWEAIELEDKTLDQMIEDTSRARFDTRLQQIVQGVELSTESHEADEVARALVEPGPVCVSGAPTNASLARLDPCPSAGFVVAAIRAHGRVLGLVFADNRFTTPTPTSQTATLDQLAHFAFYIDQTALIWENLSLLERVEALARCDALTSVFNRRELGIRLEAERSRCARSGGGFSLLVLDVDRFKETNDTRGHAAGDAVLRDLGALLKAHVRDHDVVARIGGDEFVVLLPDATPEQLSAAAYRIGSLALAGGTSLSIGGATWPEEGQDLESLLASADVELYRAKRAGRGRAFIRGEPVSYRVGD